MKKLFLFFIILGFFQGKAQEIQSSLLSTSGDYYTNESYSISWSIGEIAIETFTQTNNILTQGFQQTKLTTTGIKDNTVAESQISLYPNPVTDLLFVSFDTEKTSYYILEIFDLIGSRKIQQRVKNYSERIEIKVSDLESGMYLLHLKSAENEYPTSFLFQKID